MNYVVVDKERLEADLTTVADSIRAKGGTTEALEFPLGMKNAVESIQTGITKPEQEKTISITENGTTEVTPDEGKVLSKVTVNVDVESGGVSGEASYLEKRIKGEEYDYENKDIESIKEYAFYYDMGVKSISLPKCKTIQQQSLCNCLNLKQLYLPSLTNITGQNHIQNSKMTELLFPKVSDNSMIPMANFCYLLEKYDCGGGKQIMGSSLNNDYSLRIIILRKTTSIVALANVNAFNNCYHFHGTVNETYNPNGLKDGHVYVPRNLVSSYQTATNWSTLYASHADIFRALEDYTVDGTITGELDESKI